MASSLLGVALQLSFLFGDPASAAMQPTEDRFCDGPTQICETESQQRQDDGKHSESTRAERKSVSLHDLRQELLASSLRLASLSSAASQTLQARFAFHTLRYAIAMNNYFRVRHANENCTEQVAAWNFALDAAVKANINSYLRDIPPDCPLR